MTNDYPTTKSRPQAMQRIEEACFTSSGTHKQMAVVVWKSALEIIRSQQKAPIFSGLFVNPSSILPSLKLLCRIKTVIHGF
jgi:hypothetical protein